MSKHPRAHKLTEHPVYNSWIGLRNRCFNELDQDYHYYGGRGITVCKRWNDFASFWDDMFPIWRPGLTIDRIDTNGNYEPDNCRWISQADQNANKRSNIMIDMLDGRKLAAAVAAREIGINYETLLSRYHAGIIGPDLISKDRLYRGALKK